MLPTIGSGVFENRPVLSLACYLYENVRARSFQLPFVTEFV